MRVYTLHTKTPPPAASTKGTTLQHPGASLNVSDFRLDKLTAGVPPEQEFTLKPYFFLERSVCFSDPAELARA